jgi:hypothetical protein
MKSIKHGLRYWIATASVVGFLGSWGFLAHAQKPVPFVVNQSQPAATSPAPLPTLEPLPPLNGSNINLQPVQPLPRARRVSPFLRTGGS